MLNLTTPLTVAGYMQRCNQHYYNSRDPLGREGDFTTAPEISQLFGEMIGLWAGIMCSARHSSTSEGGAQTGQPESTHLIELGPGRGTLMADFLRTTQHIPGFHKSLSIHLVETSESLKATQKETLRDIQSAITWHDSIETVPAGYSIIIANEFFDALPIEQYIYHNGQWHERMIDQHGFTPGAPYPSLTLKAKEGDIFETSPASQTIMHSIASRIVEHGGAGLFIDYGHDEDEAIGDTLQAVKNHNYHSVLETPGEADLTAHVNFADLAHTASKAGATTWPLATQRQFLETMGIRMRAMQLMQTATPEQRTALQAGITRLLDPKEMGTLFKVLCITPNESQIPYGFG